MRRPKISKGYGRVETKLQRRFGENTMQAIKRILVFSFYLVPILFLPGCMPPEEPAGMTGPGDFGVEQPNESVAKRFKESPSEGPTAVESAIELSQKYAKLSEEAAVLRRQNVDLVAENRRLKEQMGALEAKLQGAQKELTEANDLLREMLIELNNWKTDVIGFREEIRAADRAQLEALLKILKVLGGEPVAESVPSEQQGPSAGPAGAGAGSQSQKNSAIGEPNE
jgi:hypothetical protein